jgi:peptidyl-prolyl cis-trans isomerase C
MKRIALPLFLVFLSLIGCRRTVETDVLAKVGTKKIRSEDLRRFKTEMPALLRSEKDGIEEARDYLQTMIDMELMLLEAGRQGIDREPGFRRAWEDERRKKLITEYLNRKVLTTITLPPEELQRRFTESKWSRMLRLAHIRVRTDVDAERVRRELEQGRSFEDAAKGWSIDHKTASMGGLLNAFYGRGNLRQAGLTEAIAEELFTLNVGEISRPFQIGDSYEIFRVVEERPAPDWYGGVFARVTISEEVYKKRDEVAARLAVTFDARVDQKGIARLIEKASQSNGDLLQLSESEQRLTLCRFKGGRLTLKDFTDTYQTARFFHPVTFDSSGITEFINRYMVPDALMFRAAVQEGIEREDSVAAWLATKKEAMLLDTLREREVERRIILSDEAIRRYYETHTDRFMQPEEIRVIEILVATEEEARNLMRRIQKGEDMGALAARYSIREHARENNGRFHVHPFERPIFGVLLDEVTQSEVGKLRGPVKVTEGYSVFKVVERVAPQPEPFEQAASRAKYWLKKEEEKRLFEELLHRLRTKYASKVVVFEDRLRTMNAK